jgi:hypothetical protein
MKQYFYTEALKEFIEKHPEKVEEMMCAIIQSPYQSEHGDVWVSVDVAEAVCGTLYQIGIDGEIRDEYDWEKLSEWKEINESQLLMVSF